MDFNSFVIVSITIAVCIAVISITAYAAWVTVKLLSVEHSDRQQRKSLTSKAVAKCLRTS